MRRSTVHRRANSQPRKVKGGRIVPPIVEVLWEDIFTRAGWQTHKSKEQGSAECRTVGYLLSKEQLAQKIDETLALGGNQILLQGGLHPDLGIEFYEDLFRSIKERYTVHLHALSPPEIQHISRRSRLTIADTMPVFKRKQSAKFAAVLNSPPLTCSWHSVALRKGTMPGSMR